MKHIYTSLTEEPGLDMHYTVHLHIELEESEEGAIHDFLRECAERAEDGSPGMIENDLEPFLVELRAQPGVFRVDQMEFIYPWE